MSPIKCMAILTSIAIVFTIICIIISAVTTKVEQSREPNIKLSYRVLTSRGTVKGFHVDYGSDRSELFYGAADIFLGIPFAQPPVGDLRFKLPRPVQKYDDEIGEVEYKPRCAQANFSGKLLKPSSEDCLYLNVFTPNVTGKFPVMVWIHGGAFVKGGADEYDYKGAVRSFVSNGVVVVTIQYRLGAFGFFTTVTPDFPANLGIFDQILALKWVKEEIAAFGGDPDQITLFGESAGAMSISGLSLSPQAKGLFHRLIMNSGSVLVSFFVPNDPRGSIQRLRAAQWCNLTVDPMTTALDDLQDCLANLTTDEITKFDVSPLLPRQLRWAPVLDGAVFPEQPEVLMHSRPAYDALLLDMPVEQALFAPAYRSGDISQYGPQSLKQALLDRGYGYLNADQLDRMAEILISNYTTNDLNDDDHLGWLKVVMDAISAERYTNYGRLEAEWLKARGSKVFLATFTYDKRVCGAHSVIPGYDPTTHFTDVCYLWFSPVEWEKAASEGRVTARDLAVADNFGRVYTQFAKNGTTGWPESGDDYRFMNFDDSLDQMSKDWRAKDSYVFREVLPPVIGNNPPIKLSKQVENELKINGASVLNEWQQYLTASSQ